MPSDTPASLISRRTTALVVAVLAAPLALAIFFGLWAATSIDAHRLEQEKRLASAGLQETLDRIAVEQNTSAIWDDSVIEVRARNDDWLAENLVEWVSDYFGHDRVFVIDQFDEVVRAAVRGELADDTEFSADAQIYRPLIQQLRGDMAEVSAGQSNSTDFVSGLGLLDLREMSDGSVGAISIRPIVPSSDRVHQAPGQEALHISVVLLDASLTDEIGSKFTLDDLVFTQASPGAAALPVTDQMGSVLGYLSWTSDSAAIRLLQTMAPAVLLVIVVGAAIVASLIALLRKTATRLLASQAHAQHLAFHDSLTGLPNRALFEDRLQRALIALSENGSFALHYIDLDRFKLVNDTMGHPVGDALIKAVGQRLAASVRPIDTVARIGGDEFAVIQSEAANDAQAEHFAKGVLEAFAEPIEVDGVTVQSGVSIGTALCRASVSPDDLMRKADIALYEAKSGGRGIAKLYQGDMDDLIRHQRALERDLRKALGESDGLSLAFQPIFDAAQKPVGAEALARWTHPSQGAISPEIFIALAEERGLIDALGGWVLDEACRVLASTTLPWLAINISPLQCNDPNFAIRTTAALAARDIAPDRLQIEITEGVLLANSAVVRSNLAQLRQIGVRVALDDFGTGYTSISYLRNYGIDKLKIDKSFVQSMVQDQSIKSIVEAIVALARAMDMSVTVEGVESSEQWLAATSLDIQEFQGFLIAKPMSEHDIRHLFEAKRRNAAG
jgi:diguanylate cyclase (GGDEF)-like protein